MSAKIDVINPTSNDGGLAFPGTRWQQVGTVADHGFSDDDTPTFDYVSHPGMSLRDWFAGQALASVGSFWSDKKTRAEYAKRSYLMADAMLAARKAGSE